MSFAYCQGEVEIEHALWNLIQLYYRLEAPDVSVSFMVLFCLLHLYPLVDLLNIGGVPVCLNVACIRIIFPGWWAGIV